MQELKNDGPNCRAAENDFAQFIVFVFLPFSHWISVMGCMSCLACLGPKNFCASGLSWEKPVSLKYLLDPKTLVHLWVCL